MEKTELIKKALIETANHGYGIVYTDDGGPGYLKPDDILEALGRGDFDDAEFVSLDQDLAVNTFKANRADIEDYDRYRQIIYNQDDGHDQIAWVVMDWDADDGLGLKNWE